jgi:glycosidase
MKKLKYIIICLALLNFLSAQIITSEPAYPTANDSIIIYFDATKAERTELVGYTGDLYTHTGVNTNFGEWKYVIGDWGDNSAQPQLTRIEANLYKLNIGYPREFYDIEDEDEKILSLNFVFRSADANLQTEDIFFQLYEPGTINAVVDSPDVPEDFGHPMRNPVFMEMGEVLEFKASAVARDAEMDSLIILKNGQFITGTPDSSITYTETISSYGQQEFSIIAKGVGGETDTAYYGVMVNPPVRDIEIPEGVEAGIQYPDGNSVILSLYAPQKDFIYLIGDFNDWKVDTSYYMNQDIIHPDSVWWWIRINNLEPGREYAFQYFVDGEIRVTDPYTEKVLDPWNDQYIPEATYPDLKPYPQGKTEEIVGIINTDKPEYNWQDQDYQRPDKRDLVIYELLIRDFVESQNYQGLIDKLDYLDSLGITAIELMPINEFEGNLSWGYNPAFYFAPDKFYGTELKLKEFIDECHQRGIAVILDMVLNHSTGQSPFVRLYNEGKYGRPSTYNPWFNQEARHPYNVFYDMNHESAVTKYFVDRVNKFWIEEYHIDGYRFDLSKGMTQTNSGEDVGLWGDYDQSRIDILSRMANQIWNVDDSAYVILEHFADNDEEKVLSGKGMLLWGNMNHNYNEATMGYHSGDKSDFSWGYYGVREWSKPHLVTYMESHDEERLMYKNLQWGNSSDSYNIKELPIALDRMKLANVFFLTIPGPRMIWQFGELGYDLSINWPSGTEEDRLTQKPTAWELGYYQDEKRGELYKTVKALNKLRQKYDIFTDAGQVWQENFDKPVKRIRLLGDDMQAVILGNFGVQAREINPKFLHTGIWYDFFSGDSVNITDIDAKIWLSPGEYHIYTDEKLFTPSDTLTEINSDATEQSIPQEFILSQNYPNPFNSSTVFAYTLEKESDLTVNIYDLMGRLIFTEKVNNKKAGYHRYHWPGQSNFGSDLSSGIYFFVLKREGDRRVGKMTYFK